MEKGFLLVYKGKFYQICVSPRRLRGKASLNVGEQTLETIRL